MRGVAVASSTLPWLALLLIFGSFYVDSYRHPPYTPDSWSYWELSRTVFDDFYRAVTLRDFGAVTEYSAAFPPLWPIEIAIFDRLFGLGLHAPYTLAFLYGLAVAALSEVVGRRIFGHRWIGLAVALLMTTHPALMENVLAASPIAHTIALLALVLLAYTRPGPIGPRRAALLGGLIGLVIMTRFDALPMAFVLGGLVVFAADRRLLAMTTYTVAVLTVLFPWIAYSFTTFGTPFATDNGAVALAVNPDAFVTDWFPAAQPTVMDDPRAWFAKVLGNVLPLIVGLLQSLSGTAGTTLILPAAALACLLLRSLAPQHELRLPGSPESRRFLASGLILAAAIPSYLLTGYLNPRYFAPLTWWLNLAAAGVLASALPSRRFSGSAKARGALALALALSVGVAGRVQQWENARPLFAVDPAFARPTWIADIKTCGFGTDSGRLMFVGDDLAAAQFGALTGLPTSMQPNTISQLDERDLADFLQLFDISHVYMTAPPPESMARLPLMTVPMCDGPLFRVRNESLSDQADMLNHLDEVGVR